MIRFIHALAILLLLQIGQSFSLHAQDVPLVVTDTLNWDNYQQGTEILYESPNGGYVLGNNGYGDLAKAQLFGFPNFGKLEKVLFKSTLFFLEQDERFYVKYIFGYIPKF